MKSIEGTVLGFICIHGLVLSSTISAYNFHVQSKSRPRTNQFPLRMNSLEGQNNPSSSTASAATTSPPNNQAKYGNELPLPTTYVRCGNCQASFALSPEDLGVKGKGCRVSCGLCSHSWYQSRDKLFQIKDGFELVDFPDLDVARVKANLKAGRRPNFMGVSKLYVGNLDFKCTEEDIASAFAEKAGEVGDVTIVKDPSGRSKGFGFVTMMTEEGGKKGLEMDGDELLGRTMQVREPNN